MRILFYGRSITEQAWSKAVGGDGSMWKFEVTGSETGPDGTGFGDAPFVSDSGRVKIEPADFFRNGNIVAGYTIRWQVRPMFADRCGGKTATVAQGLPNGKHTLELSGGGGAVRAVRVYRPPVASYKTRWSGTGTTGAWERSAASRSGPYRARGEPAGASRPEVRAVRRGAGAARVAVPPK